jgi:hypothetical protein
MVGINQTATVPLSKISRASDSELLNPAEADVMLTDIIVVDVVMTGMPQLLLYCRPFSIA